MAHVSEPQLAINWVPQVPLPGPGRPRTPCAKSAPPKTASPIAGGAGAGCPILRVLCEGWETTNLIREAGCPILRVLCEGRETMNLIREAPNRAAGGSRREQARIAPGEAKRNPGSAYPKILSPSRRAGAKPSARPQPPCERQASRWPHRRCLPDFQIEIPVLANQLKIPAIRGDKLRAASARGKRNQHIEVKLAQLARLVAPFRLDFGQDSS